ncbi:hypothetical protein GT755_15080 [Herbidospora sp. NEAU-GS84]|uniref:Uncharacterized protein n=1 Tax=Herbidospora solisilvae TaxID=2696284 RepID=A0A7C9MXC5_9ACTN|nr:hypothetical protein [Herbidospora solisilvae]NAS23011.1 hypothetical protein [Herbidospora solisilvae]
MRRRSSLYLTLASVISAGSLLHRPARSDVRIWAFPGFGNCLGGDLHFAIMRHLSQLDEPAWTGGAPGLLGLGVLGAGLIEVLVHSGLALVMLAAVVLAAGGGSRPARVAVRIMGWWLVIGHGLRFALLALDVASAPACFETAWLGWDGVRALGPSDALGVLNGCLLLAAARRRPGAAARLLSRPRVRRGFVRLTAAGLIASLVQTDGHRGAVAAHDCAALTYGDDIAVGEAAYLCGMRGGGRFAGIPDRDLVAYGRAACARYPLRAESVYDLAPICPLAHRDATALILSETVTYDLADAASEVFCDLNRHRPLIRPAHVASDLTWTDYGAIESWEPDVAEESAGDPPEGPLIAAAPGVLALNVDPDFDVCLTAEVYPRRPPLETKGWEQVVEVGYRSSTGHLELNDPIGGGHGLKVPGLRRGDYRIRAHFRPTDGYQPQLLLLMIFPGKGGHRREFPVGRHR